MCTSSGVGNGLNASGEHDIRGFLSTSFKPADSSHGPTFGKTSSLYSISRATFRFLKAERGLVSAFSVSACVAVPSMRVTQPVGGSSAVGESSARKGPIESISASSARTASVSRCHVWNLSLSIVWPPTAGSILDLVRARQRTVILLHAAAVLILRRDVDG